MLHRAFSSSIFVHVSDYFLRIEAWKKTFKCLLSMFYTNIKEEKNPNSFLAQEEGYVTGGSIHRCGVCPRESVSVHKSALVCIQLEASKKLSGVWLQGAGGGGGKGSRDINVSAPIGSRSGNRNVQAPLKSQVPGSFPN